MSNASFSVTYLLNVPLCQKFTYDYNSENRCLEINLTKYCSLSDLYIQVYLMPNSVFQCTFSALFRATSASGSHWATYLSNLPLWILPNLLLTNQTKFRNCGMVMALFITPEVKLEKFLKTIEHKVIVNFFATVLTPRNFVNRTRKLSSGNFSKQWRNREIFPAKPGNYQ